MPRIFPLSTVGLNGVEDAPDKLEDYKVFEDETGISTSGIRVYQPYGDHRQVPVNATYTYRVFRPLVAYFSKRGRNRRSREKFTWRSRRPVLHLPHRSAGR